MLRQSIIYGLCKMLFMSANSVAEIAEWFRDREIEKGRSNK